ncbi:alpha/beta hydrolase [Pseudomaricurvus hydrocarbonicus]
MLAAGYKTLIMDYGNVDSIAQMAGVVLSQAPEEFIVIGHSMSGRVALEVVRQAAERVTALILMDTDELPLAQESTRTARSCRAHNAGGAGKHDGMRAMDTGMVLPKHLQDQKLCDAILDMIERKTQEQFAHQQHALIHRPMPASALTCPTCSICGNQDTWSPLERHHDMAKLAPGAPPVFSIQNSGHLTTMEQPESVKDVILSRLNPPELPINPPMAPKNESSGSERVDSLSDDFAMITCNCV